MLGARPVATRTLLGFDRHVPAVARDRERRAASVFRTHDRRRPQRRSIPSSTKYPVSACADLGLGLRQQAADRQTSVTLTPARANIWASSAPT